MAEITTSQTMGNKTITTTINTAARGPKGDPGTNGTDAEVTQANIEAAITDKPGFREAIYSDSYVDIRIYGATSGVGVAGPIRTQNTAAIQEAIDTHKSVFIPAGVWEIDDELEQAWNGQVISGASMTGSVIAQTNLTANIILVSADPGSTNNPPSGSTGTSNFAQLRNLCLSGSGGVSTGSGIKTETVSPATWAGDGLKLENVWVQNCAIGYDISATAKIQGIHTLAKGCTTGYKVYGNSNNTPHFIGLSASNCTTGLDIDDCRSGYFQLADFAGNTTHITVDTSEVRITEGEIEGSSIFVNATSSRVTLENNRLLVGAGYATEPIVANASTTIWMNQVARSQHLTGTPIAKTTSNSGRIMGPSMFDFVSSTLDATANDNAMQTLGWSSNKVVRIIPIPWIDPTTWTTPSANMEGMFFATPGGGTNDPGGDIRTVVRDVGTNIGTGTQYRWASLTRPSLRSFNVTTTGNGAHFGSPDIVMLTNNSTAVAFPLNATSNNGYRASLRGGFLMTIKNRSTITHTIVPNGTDTIDGVNAAINITANQSIRIWTAGDGAWLTI